ncbi:unnamed protein product, partial [Rotaria sordida]
GASKAAVNYVTKKIHQEHKKDGLIAFPLHPGFVQTDLGNPFAKSVGMDQAPVTIEDSIKGQLKVIDGATREKTSGRFWSFDGKELVW